MTFFARTFLRWLPLGLGLTLAIGLAYVTVQQNYRMSLNDPQIQMAEDAAASIGNGASPASVLSATKIDIASSLTPWIAVYSETGTIIASSGELNGAPPLFPSGVFDTHTWHTYAEDGFAMPVPQNENRFSWQPQSDVRQAVVLVRASNGDFVAAGRNMREVENREGVLGEMVAIGWVGTMVATFAAQTLAEYCL